MAQGKVYLEGGALAFLAPTESSKHLSEKKRSAELLSVNEILGKLFNLLNRVTPSKYARTKHLRGKNLIINQPYLFLNTFP